MQDSDHPLHAPFQQAVRNSFEGKLALNDRDINLYMVRLLCQFSDAANLSTIPSRSGPIVIRDELGDCIERIPDLVKAADPITGTAPCFDVERAVRKYIGDYALYVAGMCTEPDNLALRGCLSRNDLIKNGIDSYLVVSAFNLFEYEEDASLFKRLSGEFERCVMGLTFVRDDLKSGKFPELPLPKWLESGSAGRHAL